MQNDLFASREPQTLIDTDGRAVRYPGWLEDATDLFDRLRAGLAWEQTVIHMYGRQLPIPRLNAWYGDRGSAYSYSGAYFEPRDWTPELAGLRERLHDLTGERFNSVLANCYRSGADSVAWHADDEPELGPRPLIASVSLGQSRRFVLRHNQSREQVSVELGDGDLLLMSGPLQHHWQHQLPKTRRPVGERINLTFRQVLGG